MPRTTFGPDPPVSAVPPDFLACLRCRDPCGAACPGCDEIVGSEAHGSGYCSAPQWAGTTYCACVNAPTPQAACFFAPCANSALAYVPCPQKQIVQNGRCPQSIICNQVIEIGGRENVTQNIVQQCGAITNITNQIRAAPLFAVIFFILLVALAILIAVRPSDGGDSGYPFGPVLF